MPSYVAYSHVGADNRYRVTFGPPPADSAFCCRFVFDQDAPPELPARSLSPAEYRAWEDRTCHELCMSWSWSAGSAEDLPPILPELPAGTKVEAGVFAGETPDGAPSIWVKVKNVGTVSVTALSVHWAKEAEVPEQFPGAPFDMPVLGGSLSLLRTGAERSDLSPGEAAGFYLPAPMFDHVRAVLASLSTERYWLEVRSAQHVVTRLDGSIVAAAVDAWDNE